MSCLVTRPWWPVPDTLRDVHAGFRGDPPHHGGRPGAETLLAGGSAGDIFGLQARNRGRRRSGLGGRGRCLGPSRVRSGRSAGPCGHPVPVRVDVRDDGADLDGLALRHEDFDQGSRRRRRDLGVHLVRGDLQDRLVPLDGVADLLQPLGNRALDDGFAHLGHRHFDSGHEQLLHALVRRATRTSADRGVNRRSSLPIRGRSVSILQDNVPL